MINFKFLKKLKLTKRQIIYVSVVFLALLMFYFILPRKLFKKTYSTVIYDKNNTLLSAHIADDGQWRFRPMQKIPVKFMQCITNYEDKRFYYHWGIDVLAFGRALWQNIRAGKIISGGSTISMQVIRLSRQVKDRSIREKLIEMLIAIRLEFSFSKDEILNLYASNAPFGGNVVGLEAGAWRYFQRNPENLSWAESAMLSVLPNSPGLVHPGKNRNVLLEKRNQILKRLFEKHIIDSETYELAIDEPLPLKPAPFPQNAPHLLDRIKKGNKTGNDVFRTTIDPVIQQQTLDIITRHHKNLAGKGINNVAALVIEIETGNVLAYIGNINYHDDNDNGNKVDVITAPRSTGSILKPLLYAAMLTSGEILPTTLVPDIPTQYGSYRPENYNLGYDGAVPARKALARSLNVPAVRMLNMYGIPRFHDLLKKLGMTTITQTPDYYGLSLILGGCEGSLWDITGIYASMARSLNHFHEYSSKYDRNDYFKPNFFWKSQKRLKPAYEKLDESSWFSASAIYLTFDAMIDVERPDDESSWREFSSSQRIAWKTGTSFGFRDAWSIGVNRHYAVGVWVGNADGEGRPELVGIKAAAPILFEIFDILPDKGAWFEEPIDDMEKQPICSQSGYLATSICESVDSMWIPASGAHFGICPYHQTIHLDESEKFRVNSDCMSTDKMIHRSWFILPPAMEWYYKAKYPYHELPPLHPKCQNTLSENVIKSMQMIYPEHHSKIYIPIELGGQLGRTVFEAAHRKPNSTIFWYIDQEFIGETKGSHKIAVAPTAGEHTLTLTDENGERLIIQFEIISKEK